MALRLEDSESENACVNASARPALRLRTTARRHFGVIGKRYETVGRGAERSVEERCDGILTRVRRGRCQ